MAKHTVFLVHGMSEHPDKWEEPIVGAIHAYYGDYHISQERSLKEEVRFVGLRYDDVFVKYWKAHADAAKALAGGPIVSDIKLLDLVTKNIDEHTGDGKVAKSFGDVLLYGLTNLHDLVKSKLITDISDELKADASGGWSVIAHSLGTRVITDVLQALYSTTNDGGTIIGAKTQASALSFRGAGYPRPRFVMMVANVSHLMSLLLSGNVYKNAVYPARRVSQGAMGAYINVAHDLDPFVYPNRFAPRGDFGDGNVLANDLYRKITLAAKDVTSKDVHSLEHYMRHPDVHQALFRLLLAPASYMEREEGFYGSKELEIERMQYLDESLWTGSDKHVELLGKLADSNKFSTLSQILDLWKKYGDLL